MSGPGLNKGNVHHYHSSDGGISKQQVGQDDDVAFWLMVDKLARMAAGDQDDSICEVVKEVADHQRVSKELELIYFAVF